MNIRLKPIRVILLVATLSSITLLGILIFLAWGYAYFLTHIGCLGTHDSLASRGYASEPVEFTTEAGYPLRGWFTRGSRSPEVAIIVLPGMSGDTQMALADSEVLAKAGYSTLIYEHRSCSDPALLHSGGYLEAEDLVSAVQYLASRGDVRHIGVLGFSTGGTAALLAAARTPRIEAVIAQGVPASLLGDARVGFDTTLSFERVFAELVLKFFSLEAGLSSTGVTEPVEVIGRISPRPVLLIYGEYEASKGQTLFAQAGDPKELWVVPGVGHGGYRAVNPQDYAYRVAGFFASAFSTEP
jgi:pimeloyl-ACP methyl ester carboxylesterase